MVEAAGVEPASENASDRTSTRVGTLFEVSSLSAAAGLQAQQADFVSISMRQRVRRSSLIVSVFRSYRRKLRTPSLPGFIRQREQQRYRSQLHGLPIFTWPWAPRRAIRTSSSSSKPLRPHVKEPLHYETRWRVGQGADQLDRGADHPRAAERLEPAVLLHPRVARSPWRGRAPRETSGTSGSPRSRLSSSNSPHSSVNHG